MTKQELIRATKEIASKEFDGVTLKDTTVFVDATIKAIEEALVNGDKIALTGFGNFEIVERAERKARNPRTGEEVVVGASKAVKFKPSKILKDAVNA